ncbi:MAG: hypothetical protein ABSA46_17105 [Thermodesulfovibrionales bacterium]|jgi:hypothetical protein
MKNNKKDDDKIPFAAIFLAKKEVKKIYIAVLFAVAGALIIHILFEIENRTIVFLICLALSLFSYFGIAPKIIKK